MIPQKTTSTSCLRSYLLSDIRTDILLELELLVLAFATGIQDATTFPDHRCFASNQTGNTVLIAVGVFSLGANLFDIANITISLSLFIAGVSFAGQLGNYIGVRRRWWLLLCNALQTCMVFAAAALQYRYPITLNGTMARATIVLLAFSSGAQVGMARALRMTEITTAMATAAYVDLFIDPNLLSGIQKNRPRNRRVAFLVALVLGSFAGAAAYKKMGPGCALYISAAGKALVTGMLGFNGSMEEEAVVETKSDYVQKGMSWLDV